MKARPAIVLLLVLGLRLAVSCNGFREDEVACEQAVARLKDCCPAFDPAKISCTFANATDCNGDDVHQDTLPELSVPLSHCLERASCERLQDVICPVPYPQWQCTD